MADEEGPIRSSSICGSRSTGPAAGNKNIYQDRSFRLSVINWWHVFLSYVPWGLTLAVVVLAVQLAPIVASVDLAGLQDLVWHSVAQFKAMWPLVITIFTLCYLLLHFRSRAVYLLDFACFDPPASWQFTQEELVKTMRLTGAFSQESTDFLARMIAVGSTGPATHWPPGAREFLDSEGTAPLDTSMAAARREAEEVLFPCVEEVLRKTKTSPKQIDFLIVNCSLFCPTPSLCAMVVNKFKMRSDIRSYNLSGMGCSAGLISIDLAQNLLTARPGSLALVLSTENITQQLYTGNQRSMLLQNTLFRCGGAAILLSNSSLDGFRAKYKLLSHFRYQDMSDDGYKCVYQCQDDAGNKGIHLSKDIIQIAGKALKQNLTIMGPHVLPMREQVKVLWSLVFARVCSGVRKLAEKQGWQIHVPKIAPYVPDFKTGIHHFCIHAGGRAVIDGIEKNLNLLPEDTEPSRHVLYTYGNTSSSSIWYELRYIESKKDVGRISKGERVVQIAFGSGFKCNSAVWLRLR